MLRLSLPTRCVLIVSKPERADKGMLNKAIKIIHYKAKSEEKRFQN
jgi:hypothetical protein